MCAMWVCKVFGRNFRFRQLALGAVWVINWPSIYIFSVSFLLFSAPLHLSAANWDFSFCDPTPLRPNALHYFHTLNYSVLCSNSFFSLFAHGPWWNSFVCCEKCLENLILYTAVVSLTRKRTSCLNLLKWTLELIRFTPIEMPRPSRAYRMRWCCCCCCSCRSPQARMMLLFFVKAPASIRCVNNG